MTLFGEPGWGSVLVEAQLRWYGIDHDFERVGDLFKSAEARERLAAVNPLAQIPTLLLGDGTVMTESAAITLWLAERTGSAALVPAPSDPIRGAFLRWLIFLVANVYPTYTYGDDPSRFVHGAEAQRDFRAHVERYATKLYAILDAAARGPWFLGERFSALDIYVGVMTRWRPGRSWFGEQAPRLHAIAVAADAIDVLVPVWQRNFPQT